MTSNISKDLIVKYEKMLWERFGDIKMLKSSISSFASDQEINEMINFLIHNPEATMCEVLGKEARIELKREGKL